MYKNLLIKFNYGYWHFSQKDQFLSIVYLLSA